MSAEEPKTIVEASMEMGMNHRERMIDDAEKGVARLLANYPTMPTQITAAVLNTMNRVRFVEKRGENTVDGYKFVAIGDLLAQVQAALVEAGLVIIQSEHGEWKFLGPKKEVLRIEYQFWLQHASGAIWKFPGTKSGLSEWALPNGRFDTKAANKCETTAGKYFILTLFKIPTGLDDPDNDGVRDQPERSDPRDADGMTGITDLMRGEAVTLSPENMRQRNNAAGWVRIAKDELAELESPEDARLWWSTNREALEQLQRTHRDLFADIDQFHAAQLENLSNPRELRPAT